MTFALLAGRHPGLDIAAFLARSGTRPACLFLDAADPDGVNDKIIGALGIPSADTYTVDKHADANVAAALAQRRLELAICAWWPYLIAKDALRAVRTGFLNLHPSLLPYDRGKNPNFWSIVDGTPAGVTLHWLDEGIDSGAVAFQERVDVTWEDTGQSLYARLQAAAVQLFIKHWQEVRAGAIPRIPQREEIATIHRSQEMESMSSLELGRSYAARDLLNLLRARTFPPYPAAHFQDAGKTYEVRVEIKERKDGR